jgi:hypothetical protein
MLNAFGIILFYKVVWWFDGQNINVEPNIYLFIYLHNYTYLPN